MSAIASSLAKYLQLFSIPYNFPFNVFLKNIRSEVKYWSAFLIIFEVLKFIFFKAREREPKELLANNFSTEKTV